MIFNPTLNYFIILAVLYRIKMSYSTYLSERTWRLRTFFARESEAVDLNQESIINMDPEEEEEVDVSHRNALIYGGCGSLGSKCIYDLKANGWWVASVDFTANTHADVNVLIFREDDPTQHEKNVASSIKSTLANRKLDMIFCTTGCYKDGGVADDLVQTGIEMWQEHLVPSMICASISEKCLKLSGILILKAALSATKPSPDKIAYSVAKSAVIHLTKCLAEKGSGMPVNSTVVCLLPLRLDTASNRSMQRHTDIGSFTPLQYVSDLVMGWGNKKDLPVNGALCQLLTNNFNTDCIIQQ